MKWIIITFNHPENKHSIIYKQDLSEDQLLYWIQQSIERGANLMSIRGIKE